MNYSSVIIKPLITEKSVSQAAQGKYTFLINVLSTKEDVKTAMKKVFGVNPIDVNISKYRDHRRRINIMDPRKGSIKRKTVTFKKAVIKLSADEKIDYFDID